jgi:aminoglycoside 6'-N-acetyltransferase
MDPRYADVTHTGVGLRSARTMIRLATAADVDLLVGWHSDPDVARFWDLETYTAEQLGARLGRDDVRAFIVEEGGVPVGYIEAWTDEDWRSGGLDMFLVPRARGRGLGPEAARALATHLVEACGWARVTVDPYVWNTGAIRAWRRAGFEPEAEHPPDAGHSTRWLLMRFS